MFGNGSGKKVGVKTLIGEGTSLEGELRFKDGCHIDGTVKGSVRGEDDPGAVLSISESGVVEGDIHVAHLVLGGTVNGDVYVSERVELGATARVNGNVHYSVIEMAGGAGINGQLIHQEAREQRGREPVELDSGGNAAILASGTAEQGA